MSKIKIFLFSVLAVLVVILYVYLSNPLVVTVQGVGQVDAIPDGATIALVVYTQKASAKEANDEVNTKTKLCESILATYGATSLDIVKSQTTIVPSGLNDSNKAFSASVSLGAKINNVEKMDNLISVLYANGVYYVSQPVLTVNDSYKLEEDAYSKALADADKRLNNLDLKGIKLFQKKTSITQYSVGDSNTVTTNLGSQSDQEAQNISGNSMNTFKITKMVSVTYKIWLLSLTTLFK